MGHRYEILSLYIGINIRSNIYNGLTHRENTTYYVMKPLWSQDVDSSALLP